MHQAHLLTRARNRLRAHIREQLHTRGVKRRTSIVAVGLRGKKYTIQGDIHIGIPGVLEARRRVTIERVQFIVDLD